MDRIIGSVARQTARSGSRITFYQDDGVVSYGLSELDALAFEVADRLRGLDLEEGDRIGILARNRSEWVLLDLAAIKLKLVTAAFEHGRFAPDRELIDAYGLKVVFTDNDTDTLADGFIDIRTITAPGGAGIGRLARRPPPQYADDDVTTIKFTSGSTGRPKGLAATVGSIDSSISAVQAIFRHDASDTLFVFLPLSLLQQRYWIYSALHYGHDIVVATYELAFYALRRERPTVVMGVPSFYEAVRRQIESKLRVAAGQAAGADGGGPEPAGGDAAALRMRRACADRILGGRIRYLWTGSAPASPGMLHFFFDCGIPIYEGYGLNESCIVSKNYEGAVKIGSVGKVLAGKEVRIGEDGVLVIRSEHPVNRRYLFCEPGESEKIFLPNGDVRTGDIGYVDADGFLFIRGRADDVIVLGNGKNIVVRPIEERLKDSPAIEECVLFGAGRPYLLAVVSAGAGVPDRDGIAAHIDRVNRELGKDERVGKFLIAKERFAMENGLLTSQYKPRRKEILRMHQAEIEQAYGGR
jgi:long-subunit acyl-CoA synthetase (AMP-forming)